MQSFFKKVISNNEYLVMTEAILMWVVPAIILSLISNILPIEMVQVITKCLFIFTIIDVCFCVGMLIIGGVKNKKQEQLNMETEVENSIENQKGEDLWLKNQVVMNSKFQ